MNTPATSANLNAPPKPSGSIVVHRRLVRLTPAQQDALNDMSDGSILRVSWLGGRGSITKQNGMTKRIQRRVATALVNSGLLTQLKYDGRLRDIYSYQPNDRTEAQPVDGKPRRENDVR